MKKQISVLLLLCGLFFACSSEQDLASHENISINPDPYAKFIISYQKFLKKVPATSLILSKLVKPSEQNRISLNAFLQSIDSTEVMAFEFEKVQTYTFKVVTRRSNRETFTNLVVTNDVTGNVSEKLYEYIPNQEWLADPTSAFKGSVNLIDVDGNIIQTYVPNTVNGFGCDMYSYNVNVPCNGVGHMPGEECECGKTGSSCDQQPYSFTVYVIDCGGGGGGGGTGGGGTGGGGGGSSTPPWANGPFYPGSGIGSGGGGSTVA